MTYTPFNPTLYVIEVAVTEIHATAGDRPPNELVERALCYLASYSIHNIDQADVANEVARQTGGAK